jgi:hypothetical protein
VNNSSLLRTDFWSFVLSPTLLYCYPDIINSTKLHCYFNVNLVVRPRVRPLDHMLVRVTALPLAQSFIDKLSPW